MFRTIIHLFLLCFFGLSLTACSSFQNKTENQQAVCKELKYRMIFNGATPNQQEAMQQRAEVNNLNKSYREDGCQ